MLVEHPARDTSFPSLCRPVNDCEAKEASQARYFDTRFRASKIDLLGERFCGFSSLLLVGCKGVDGEDQLILTAADFDASWERETFPIFALFGQDEDFLHVFRVELAGTGFQLLNDLADYAAADGTGLQRRRLQGFL
jgi:hypothetical protein